MLRCTESPQQSDAVDHQRPISAVCAISVSPPTATKPLRRASCADMSILEVQYHGESANDIGLEQVAVAGLCSGPASITLARDLCHYVVWREVTITRKSADRCAVAGRIGRPDRPILRSGSCRSCTPGGCVSLRTQSSSSRWRRLPRVIAALRLARTMSGQRCEFVCQGRRVARRSDRETDLPP